MHLRYAIRTLAKTPGFVLVSVITLAIGITVNTVVFSVYQSVVLKPLAVKRPAEIVRITGTYDGSEIERFSYGQYERLHGAVRTLTSVIATSPPQNVLGVTPGSQPAASQVL